MFNLLSNKIEFDNKNNVIGIDIDSVIPVFQYFKIKPENSANEYNNLNTIAKIINSKVKK